NSHIFVLDSGNQFIYPNKKSKIIEASFLEELEDVTVKNYTSIPINGTDYMMVYNESSYSGVKTIMLTPHSVVFSEVNHLRIMIMVVVVIGILISLLLGFILSKPLVQSIYKLRKAMDNVQKGNLSQRVEL